MNNKELLLNFINYCEENKLLPELGYNSEQKVDDYLSSRNSGNTHVSGALPPSLNYLKVLIPRAKVELEICLSELGHEPPILNRLVSKLEDFISGNDR